MNFGLFGFAKNKALVTYAADLFLRIRVRLNGSTPLRALLGYRRGDVVALTAADVAGLGGLELSAMSGGMLLNSLTSTHYVPAIAANATYVYVVSKNGSQQPTLHRIVASTNAVTHTTIEAVSESTSLSSSIVLRADGSFATLTRNTSGHPRLTQFSSGGGGISVGPTTVEAVPSALARISLILLQSGDTVSIYTDVSNYVRFSRHNSSNTLQGAATLVYNANPSYSPFGLALPTGEFLVLYRGPSGFLYYGRYSSTGVLQGSLTAAGATAITHSAGCVLSDGTFILASVVTGAIELRRYTATCVLISQASLTIDTTTEIFVVAAVAGDFFLQYRLTNSAGLTYTLRLAKALVVSATFVSPANDGMAACQSSTGGMCSVCRTQYAARLAIQQRTGSGALVPIGHSWSELSLLSAGKPTLVRNGTGFGMFFQNSANSYPQQIMLDVYGVPRVAPGQITGTIFGSAYSGVETQGGVIHLAVRNASTYACLLRVSQAGAYLGVTVVTSQADTSRVGIALLTSGETVVAANYTGTYPNFARYNESGALQGALTAVESVANTGVSTAIIALGTGFVVGYLGASGYPKFARFDATGTLVGAITWVSSSAAATTVPFNLLATQDGGFLYGVNLPSSMLYKYNASGVFQYSFKTLATTTDEMILIETPDANIAVISRDVSGYLTVTTYSAAGVLISHFVASFTTVSNTLGAILTADRTAILISGLLPNTSPFFVAFSTKTLTILGVSDKRLSASGDLDVIIGRTDRQRLMLPLAIDLNDTSYAFDDLAKGGNKGTLLNNTVILDGFTS